MRHVKRSSDSNDVQSGIWIDRPESWWIERSVATQNAICDTVLPMSISTILALLALVVALINAANGKAPLWIAVALLALAMIIPGVGLVR